MKKSENTPSCPYCGKPQGIWPSTNEDDHFVKVSNCRECGKPFVIEGYAIWVFETKKIEGE
jgi:ssDNA-binding Zn-finger/Zn-ribbon topoisomerase 1